MVLFAWSRIILETVSLEKAPKTEKDLLFLVKEYRAHSGQNLSCTVFLRKVIHGCPQSHQTGISSMNKRIPDSP